MSEDIKVKNYLMSDDISLHFWNSKALSGNGSSLTHNKEILTGNQSEIKFYRTFKFWESSIKQGFCHVVGPVAISNEFLFLHHLLTPSDIW